ncbi:MAG: orotate phosphoribosyltransferase [Saprospiraceae bacterium]|nr:orotate phosphoribosyltransferase [Saprospiraceae bacterium]MDW8485059.1 orotate phosphoribosyltransferase [Saprospiraceae bacterium]
MSPSAEVARRLLEIRAVQLRPNDPFTWASGLLSPIYCDNRIALSYPAVRTLIKHALRERAQAFAPFEAIVGVATAGIAPGVLLADLLELPFAYVRSSAKEHGLRNRIEGFLLPQQRVLVVEDLISTGGSSLSAVEALREAGCVVVGVLAIFQYGLEKATAAFEAQNVPFATLTDYPTLLREALNTGYIDEQGHLMLEHWRQNPEGWGALYA